MKTSSLGLRDKIFSLTPPWCQCFRYLFLAQMLLDGMDCLPHAHLPCRERKSKDTTFG
uniref:Uncharacterized protein n=1 Tax=Rhizophora mucronata TaxID=61149 RepID=A0A2P2P0N4_RHIMU